MPKANNGNSRGLCHREKGHSGKCGNITCFQCGIPLTKKNSAPSMFTMGAGDCRSCRIRKQRYRQGHNARRFQIPESKYTFACGCTGILPKKFESNKFAIGLTSGGFGCRLTRILNASQRNSERDGGKPMDINTPHTFIRTLMKKSNCVICDKLLRWEIGTGKTPHLHHDHITGGIIGFSHGVCNPKALEKEILLLRKKVEELSNA